MGRLRAESSLASTTPSRLASGSGQVWVVARGELTDVDDSIICTLLAAARHPAPAGSEAAARGELACFDNSIICTLRAAVRHLAPGPAGCETAAPGLRQLHHLHSVRHPAPAGCGARRAESSLASITTSSSLCGSPSGSARERDGGARRARWIRQLHHLHSAGHRLASGSGRVWVAAGSALTSTTPSSALCGPPSGRASGGSGRK